MKARATIHGAVSLVNAIATSRGATLGISLKAQATVQADSGCGITIKARNQSTRLIRKTIQRVATKRQLAQNSITVVIDSEIPTGYGLKSSSAVSSAVALACAKIFRPGWSDRHVLCAGVDASIESKVSMTGAFDDACACYYGGFNVTDNARRRRVHHEKAPAGLCAVIFVPKSRRRGNPKKLKNLATVFDGAWKMARAQNYWDAMMINGLATATILNSDPGTIARLVDRGALGASVSGNGPAVAAVARTGDVPGIRRVFSQLDGHTITSNINNKRATVHEL